MKLNDQQEKTLLEKLDKFWQQSKKCPICGKDEWDVSDTIFELREFHRGSMAIGGQSKITPIIHVCCKNCSYTMLFNAIKLGLINKNDPKENIAKPKRKH